MTARQFHRISKALADPTRYQLLTRIARRREIQCLDLRDLPIGAPTLSHHLKELSNTGLIEVRREARCMHLKLERTVWREYLAQLKKLQAPR